MSEGYVYILTNPSMPGVVKVGKTTGAVEARCRALQGTGVPCAFDAEVVSPSAIKSLANEAGVNGFDIVAAMELLSANEIRPALDRWFSRIEASRK